MDPSRGLSCRRARNTREWFRKCLPDLAASPGRLLPATIALGALGAILIFAAIAASRAKAPGIRDSPLAGLVLLLVATLMELSPPACRATGRSRGRSRGADIGAPYGRAAFPGDVALPDRWADGHVRPAWR